MLALETTAEAVGLAAAGAGVVIYEMTAEHVDLEEMFLELTTTTAGGPMTHLIRAELLKLRTTRMFWGNVIAVLAFVPSGVALAMTAAGEEPLDSATASAA